MYTYSAKIEDGFVTQVIVGNPDWASSNLDGFWVGTNDRPSIGWTWNETDGFQPPVSVEQDEAI